MSSQRGANGFPLNPHPVGSLEWGIEVDRRETINQKRKRKEESRQNLKFHNTLSQASSVDFVRKKMKHLHIF